MRNSFAQYFYENGELRDIQERAHFNAELGVPLFRPPWTGSISVYGVDCPPDIMAEIDKDLDRWIDGSKSRKEVGE